MWTRNVLHRNDTEISCYFTKHHVRDELEPQVLLFCFEITRRLTKVRNFLKLLPYKRINLSCIHNREWRTDSWDFSHNPDYEMAMSTSDTRSVSKTTHLSDLRQLCCVMG